MRFSTIGLAVLKNVSGAAQRNLLVLSQTNDISFNPSSDLAMVLSMRSFLGKRSPFQQQYLSKKSTVLPVTSSTNFAETVVISL